MVEAAIPLASHEEKLAMSNEYRQFFDVLIAIAIRLHKEGKLGQPARDNPGKFASVETTHEI